METLLSALSRKEVERSAWRFAFLLLWLACLCVLPLRADDFTKPTQEELEMTSLPGYPGAPAVVLNQELLTKDDLHVQQFYFRIKILTEEGKKYANVELKYGSTQNNGDYVGDDNQVGDVIGRTIHADGTVIPFTGKPYLKTIEKGNNYKLQERVFTLPDVEVGSIIEYRYALRYNDEVYESPSWFIQGDLFVKNAHYVWYPTARDMVEGDTGNPVNAISWFAILPPGAQIDHHDLPGSDAVGNTHQIYELKVKDVPPMLEEEFMPPLQSFSYRVLFNFTAYRSADDYWKSKGKSWSKGANSFIGPNAELRDATQKIIAGASTDDEKLRRIYTAVMALDNTDFSREHERQEDKAAGLGKVNNTSDVLSHKRGDGVELTELFIGMARAIGLKAYLMIVTSRNDSFFTPQWLNMRQLDSVVAIVNIGGKDMFFDPGSRYIPYGRLTWGDTETQGIRQVDGGTAFAATPVEPYSANKVARVANLNMDEQGQITGTINMSYIGASALNWRQRALRGDNDSIRHALRTSLEGMLPRTLRVEVAGIENLNEYEQPLTVDYRVTGTLGTPTGKRLILPVDLFESQSRATFPQEKREQAVYFPFPKMVQDAIRVNFPKDYSLEATPASSRAEIKGKSLYVMDVAPAPTNVTVRRTYIFNDVLVKKEEYPQLRGFYQQFEAKDQDSVVLKLPSVSASGTTSTPAGGN